MEKEIIYKVKADGIDEVNKKFKDTNTTIDDSKKKFDSVDKSVNIVKKSNKDLTDSLAKVDRETKKVKQTNEDSSKSFGKVGSALSSLKVGYLALVGVVGMVVSKIGDSFMSMINSTQTLGDKWAGMMGGMKSATASFFQSIAEGDWSNLIDNMTTAYEAGKKYVEQLDRIYDMQNALSITLQKLKTEEAELMNTIKDKSKADTERYAAIDKYEENLRKQYNERVKVADAAYDTESENLSTLTGLRKEDILWLSESIENQDKAQAAQERLKKISEDLSLTFPQRTDLIKKEDLTELANLWSAWQKITDSSEDGVKASRDTFVKAAMEREKLNTEYAQSKAAAIKNRNMLEALIKGEINSENGKTETVIDNSKDEAIWLAKMNLLKEKSAYREIELLNAVKNKALDGAKTNAEILYLEEQFLIDKQAILDKYNTPEEVDNSTAEAERLRLDNLRVQFESEQEMLRQQSLSRIQILQEELAQRQMLQTEGVISDTEYANEYKRINAEMVRVKIESEQAKRQADLMSVASSAGALSSLATNMGALMGKEAKAAKFAQGLAIFSSSANIAAGFAKTAAIGFPQNIPMLLAYGAQTVGVLAQIKQLAMPKPPKLAKGGMIGGNPHSLGGTTFRGTDGSIFEAERGEYLAVINKRDANRAAMLDAINSKHGVSFKKGNYFANGGVFTPNDEYKENSNDVILDAINKITNIPVTVLESDISNTQRRVYVLENDTNL